ncbi:MAG: hypothetical protein HPY79_05530 [Bacteroidales bacterium]|nr:hypothetical protein [Bacteroidales bacterium]
MKTLVTFCLLIYSAVLLAQKQIYTTHIVKNFPVTTTTTLYIENFNGDIEFELWNQNNVEAQVTFEVITPKIEKAKQFLQAFTLNTFADSSLVKFISLVNRDMLDKSFNNGRSTFKIHYHLKIPVYLNLNIKNKYGDIILTETSGAIDIKLRYGKCTINQLTADESKPIPQLDLAYASCSIQKANWLNIEADYSVLKVNKAIGIILQSKYSDVIIDDIYSLKITSKYDQIELKNISKFNSDINYSHVNIGFLKTEFQATAKYSPIYIKDLYEEFTSVTCDLYYSDFTAKINSQSCFKISSTVEYGKNNLPRRSNVDNIITPTSMKTNGTVGCIKGASSQVNIVAKYGDINFIE